MSYQMEPQNDQEEYEYCVDILNAIRFDLDSNQFAYVAGKLGIDTRAVPARKFEVIA